MNKHLPLSDVRGETSLVSSMSYYVVMVNFGRIGREAVVDPEMTRRGAIEKVREVLGDGDRKEIVFVHHITMNELPQDVTEEFVAEAMAMEAA